MTCTNFLKARVSPEIKFQAKAVADREFLSETAWLKRLVLRELRACDGAPGSAGESSRAQGNRRQGREARGSDGGGKPMLVRLRAEDRLLLDARAEARGMRPATYASVLLRSHLRQLTPLPKDELLALKRSIGEHKAEHFAVADVPVGDLVDISEFLSDLVDLKLDARVAALLPK